MKHLRFKDRVFFSRAGNGPYLAISLGQQPTHVCVTVSRTLTLVFLLPQIMVELKMKCLQDEFPLNYLP